MSLENKTVLVVGGGTGIGRSAALDLAKAGAKVAVAGRREEPLLEVAQANEGPHAVFTKTADMADRDNTQELVQWAEEQLGHLDIVINSAGINTPKRLMHDLDPEDWDRVLQINATGAYNLMRGVLPKMRERNDGLIINISSVSGIRAGLLGGVAYCASKFAMAALGLTTALEDGKHGVRVTTIYPGEVETPILDQRPVPVSAEHRARILQPEDVSAAIKMICELPPRAHIPELTIKPTSQDFS